MRLIINADDLGIDQARNRGIFQAADAGILKSTSVIVGQGGWADAISGLKKRPFLGAGLHFNLTAGKPLIREAKTLTKKDGDFFDKFELWKRAGLQLIDPQDVARELTAQLEMFPATGIVPTHIDGHNHVHLLPGVREGFIRVVPKGSWVRIPRHTNTVSLNPQNKDSKEVLSDLEKLLQALQYFSQLAKNEWQGRYRYVDDFGGTTLTDEPTLEGFKKEIRDLKGEVCELMCHPGDSPDEDSVRFSKLKARQTERDILISVELKSFLEKAGIETVSYRDIEKRNQKDG